MKLKYIAYTCVCLLLLATACSKDDENKIVTADCLRVTAAKTDFTDEHGRTRAVTDEEPLLTTFETGDAIGITAVDKDGNVLADCNNIKLVYNANTGSWEGEDVYFLAAAKQYFAYSPYSTSMNGKASTDAVYAAFTPGIDQSTKELFAAADLMTSTTCTADKTNKTLNIAFAHRMTMIEVPARVETLYAKTDISSFEYPIANHTFKSLLINGLETMKYYTTSSSKTRRYLVAPGTKDIILSASYQDNLSNTNRSCEGTVDAPTVGGTCIRVYFSKSRNLAIGDAYYEDGSIWPVEFSPSLKIPNPDKAIGIVYQTEASPSRISQEEKDLGFGHGYIVGYKYMNQPPIIADTWGEIGILNSAAVKANMTSAKTDINGYVETKTNRALVALKSTKYKIWQLDSYGPEPLAGVTRSSWYIPAFGQLYDILMFLESNWKETDTNLSFDLSQTTSLFTTLSRYESPGIEAYYFFVTSTEQSAESTWGFCIYYDVTGWGTSSMAGYAIRKDLGPFSFFPVCSF